MLLIWFLLAKRENQNGVEMTDRKIENGSENMLGKLILEIVLEDISCKW